MKFLIFHSICLICTASCASHAQTANPVEVYIVAETIKICQSSDPNKFINFTDTTNKSDLLRIFGEPQSLKQEGDKFDFGVYEKYEYPGLSLYFTEEFKNNIAAFSIESSNYCLILGNNKQTISIGTSITELKRALSDSIKEIRPAPISKNEFGITLKLTDASGKIYDQFLLIIINTDQTIGRIQTNYPF